jgi:Tfp pilus assembly ATPase PilU
MGSTALAKIERRDIPPPPAVGLQAFRAVPAPRNRQLKKLNSANRLNFVLTSKKRSDDTLQRFDLMDALRESGKIQEMIDNGDFSDLPDELQPDSG